MRTVLSIFVKEFRGYFVSPIAYIVISIFLLITGWFYFTTFFLVDQANLRNFFQMLPFVFSFVVPAVTMRLFAEERHVGSYELLLTLPVTTRQVVLGKFFAGLAFVAALLAPTLLYAATVGMLGEMDWGPVAGGYFGALLLGGAFCAVGLFASSLTRNQIVAFIIGTAICYGLTLIDRVLFFLPQTLLGFFHFLGIDSHFQNVAKGIIDSRDIVYFLSLMFVGLYATHLAMEGKNR
ncbi:MAG: ABC transporter permease [Desulfobacteraceae bacterium]|jgi:ABC-2 type transport system permease protein|nr:ABC transporter permease [Desulfobacteraceae bacterium]